jgi:CSLREA domain-containing protein
MPVHAKVIRCAATAAALVLATGALVPAALTRGQAPSALVAPPPVIVDTLADSLTVDGHCSLREAVLSANAGTTVDTCVGGPGPNRVVLAPARYELSLPGRDEDAGLSGDLDISSTLTIRGAGAARTIIDASGVDRIFDIVAGATVRLERLTVTGGSTRTDGCCGSPGQSGGAIANRGTLAVLESHVTDSASGGAGGGVFSTGRLAVRNTVVRGNSASDGAGGIAATGPLTITDSRIVDNQALESGSVKPHRDDPGVAAGIDSRQPLTMRRSTVTRNVGHGEWTHGGVSMLGGSISDSTISHNVGGVCGSGGVVMIWGAIRRSTVARNVGGECDGAGGVVAIDSEIWNSTISGNIAGGPSSPPSGSMQVGGVLSDVSTIVGTTITRNVNRAPDRGSTGPGGLWSVPLSPATSAANLSAIRDSIVAGNRDASGAMDDCAGPVTSDGHNLVGTAAGCDLQRRSNDIVGVPPRLGPLASNGGMTLTHRPLPGSPAIDAWFVDSGDRDCPRTDQRGQVRPSDGNGDQVAGCDIGAVEVSP